VQIKNSGFGDIADYTVDLNTGAFVNGPLGDADGTITTKANGFYSIKQHFTTSSTGGYIFLIFQDDAGNEAFAGDGTKGIIFAKGSIQ
jgi:hypothetical protein